MVTRKLEPCRKSGYHLSLKHSQRTLSRFAAINTLKLHPTGQGHHREQTNRLQVPLQALIVGGHFHNDWTSHGIKTAHAIFRRQWHKLWRYFEGTPSWLAAENTIQAKFGSGILCCYVPLFTNSTHAMQLLLFWCGVVVPAVRLQLFSGYPSKYFQYCRFALTAIWQGCCIEGHSWHLASWFCYRIRT